jgi:hypothetical protein
MTRNSHILAHSLDASDLTMQTVDCAETSILTGRRLSSSFVTRSTDTMAHIHITGVITLEPEEPGIAQAFPA